MADTAAPALPALTGAGTAIGDFYVVHDTSANALSRQTPDEVMNALIALGGTAFDNRVGTTAVPKTLVDAKGDLLVGTADNVVARQAVGANDTVLTADSAQASGVKWQTPIAVQQPINAQTASYTVLLTDVAKLITMNNAGAVTVTMPSDATAAIPIGCWVEILQIGAGQVTVAAGAGATLVGGPTAKARAVYSRLFVQKVAANTWALAGDLAAT